jgi:cytochrome P450
VDLGQVLQALQSEDGRADPYPRYEALRTAGPVLAGGPDYAVAVGYPECDAVLRDPAFRVEDAQRFDHTFPGWRRHPAVTALTSSILDSNAPDHERMRRAVSGAFTARRVAALRETIAGHATRFADWLAGAAGEPVDFVGEFAYPLPITVICDLLGVPTADRGWFRSAAGSLTRVLELGAESDLAEADAAAVRLREYFEALAADRRREPGEDFISALAVTEGALAPGELLANLTVLLVAGFETTAGLLANGLYALLRHPAEMAALRADPGLVGGYVEEMLRYDPPVQLTSRYVTRPAKVGEVPLSAGGSVLLLLGAANRDPRRFVEPDRFWPDRPGGQSGGLAFGGGAHYCVGAALARLEAQVAFPVLLSRLGAVELAGTPTFRPSLVLRGFATLPIVASPSVASPSVASPGVA